MGVLSKVLDLVLTLYLLIIAIGAPLIDSQTFLPNSIFPVPLVQLKQYYIREYGDYLMSEKPSFFVGIVWLELLFQWPLCLANLYGIWSGKSWVSTTCLMYGVSVLTAMAAILSEMTASGKASDKMKMAYFPFLGLGILAILRGFLPGTRGTTSAAKNGPASVRKKRI